MHGQTEALYASTQAIEFNPGSSGQINCADKLCDNFRTAGSNGCLNFSLLASSLPLSQLAMQNVEGFKELRLTKETVAPWQQRLADWMLEGSGRLSVGVRHRHPVIMHKACTALSRQVDKRQGSCAQCLGTSTPPKTRSRLSSETRVYSFLRNAPR